MRIKQAIQQSIETKQRLFDDEVLIARMRKIANEMIECYKEDGKVFFCGNGGSAADAQHLAAELSGRAVGREGDMLIGISTSGNSKNIVNAMQQAREQNMITVAFTGDNGGELKEICDYVINVPSNDTPRIQESHILVGHIICELVETALFPKK